MQLQQEYTYHVLLVTIRGVLIWEFWFLLIVITFCQNLLITDHRSNVDFTLTCHAVLEH